MPGRLTRLARAIIRRYPKAWRDRYEIEIVGFIEDGPVRWGDVLDLARGCVVECARAFVAPETHPTRAWMLLGVARFLPALAMVVGAMALGAALRAAIGDLPPVFGYYAFSGTVGLMLVWGLKRIRANLPPGMVLQGPPVAPPTQVLLWLVAYLGCLVVAYWSNPPDNDWHSLVWHPLVLASLVRYALDLYAPSKRLRSDQVVRIMGLREQLGWARLELTRCESLAAQDVVSAELIRAREEVARLERELASAVSAVRQAAHAPRAS